MLLTNIDHTVGDVRRHIVDYSDWLVEGVVISTASVTSPSSTTTIGTVTLDPSKRQVWFFLQGGLLNETLTLSLQVTDGLGNIVNDTVNVTVVAP